MTIEFRVGGIGWKRIKNTQANQFLFPAPDKLKHVLTNCNDCKDGGVGQKDDPFTRSCFEYAEVFVRSEMHLKDLRVCTKEEITQNLQV